MTVQNLYDDIDFLVATSSDTYSTTDKLRNMNIAYQNVARLIWEAQGRWQYDDSNATDFGIATQDSVVDQHDYELPSTCQRVEKIEVKDGSGNYVLLKERDLHDIDIATSEYMKTSGTPIIYDLLGRSAFVYPAFNSVRVAGVKIYFDRDVTNLAATTDTPGFATAFHRILSLAASIDYSKNDVERQNYIAQKAILENGLKRFYSSRTVQGQITIRPAGKKRWRKYL